MAATPNLPGDYAAPVRSFTITNTTQAKVLVERQLVSAPLQGGFRLVDGVVSSSDGTARSLILWQGEELTNQADAGTPVIATTSTITRSSGSFLADGWQPGDGFMIVENDITRALGATLANYRNEFILTAVAALTLTVNGTPLIAEAIAAGARLVRTALLTRLPIAINAGNADATPPVPLITGTQNPNTAPLPDSGWQFGPRSLLLASMVATISALPAKVNVTTRIVRY